MVLSCLEVAFLRAFWMTGSYLRDLSNETSSDQTFLWMVTLRWQGGQELQGLQGRGVVAESAALLTGPQSPSPSWRSATARTLDTMQSWQRRMSSMRSYEACSQREDVRSHICLSFWGPWGLRITRQPGP